MKTILKQVLITPGNYRHICARIVPQDQRDAIRPGIRVSHWAFTDSHGHQGYVIISHTTGRAGICFGEGRSQWGRWDEGTGVLSTDDGQRYNRVGEQIVEGEDQLLVWTETLSGEAGRIQR
jgi:hypothetical protein